MILRLLGNERGTASVLVAAGLVVLVGFLALVSDAGLLFINRARVVNALDSAVLAGVQELPGSPAKAVETAQEYAEANGLPTEECHFSVADDFYSISGEAQRPVGFFFARVLGMSEGQVKGHAAARIRPVSACRGIVPFGVREDNYSFGQMVTLKEGAGEGPYHGWFGALRLGGNGACVYENNVKYGYNGRIEVGDIIPIEAGNMSGPTKRAIAYRINQCQHCPRCSADSYVEGCSRVLIVPIIRFADCNPAGHPFTVEVVGFAAFLVNRYTGSGQDNEVEGAFIRYVLSADDSSGAGDYGLYSGELYE